MSVTSPIHAVDRPHLSWRRLQQIRHEHGWRGLFFKALDGSVYRRLHVYTALSEIPTPSVQPGLSLAFTPLKPDHLDAFLKFRTGLSRSSSAPRPDPWLAAENWVRTQWAAGHECHLALHQDQIVSSLWIARSTVEISHLACSLSMEDDTAFVFDAFTSPAFRGRNIAPALSVQVLQLAFSRRTRRILTAILPENRPGLRAQLKAGFVRAGGISVFSLPPFKHPFCHVPGCRFQPATPADRASTSR